MFEFLPPVGLCGHAMQRRYLRYFKISKKKFVRQGGGVVGGGVGYRDSRAVCLAMSSVTQDRHKKGA